MSAIKISDKVFTGLPGPPEIRTKLESNPAKSSSNNSLPNVEPEIHQIAVRYQEHLFHNQLASELKAANRDLDNTDELLARMQENLGRIVKNFPPYPADSPERAKLLQSFIALRKEIERLMVPPPEDAILGKITEKAVRPDIPSLSPQAADKEIERALLQLTVAKEQLNRQRESLMQEAATMAKVVQAPVRLVEWLRNNGINTALIDERQAEQQSKAVGNALASERSAHITTMQDLLPR